MMVPDHTSPALLRFGVFEMDLRTAELRKSGRLVSLAPQPFKILALLATHSGELVTRDEIQRQIWGGETFVDFDQGLNFAIKKIRTALGDDADAPRYIETLPRRGYRFIARVDHPDSPALGTAPVSPEVAASPSTQFRTDGFTRRAIETLVDAVIEHRRASQRWAAIALGASGLVALLVLMVRFNLAGLRDRIASPHPSGRIQSLAVLPLENLSGDKEQGYLADGLTDALIARLAQTGLLGSLRVVSRTTVMQYKGSSKPLPQIARELNVDAIVEGTMIRSGNRLRTTVQLLLANEDKHLWAQTYERDAQDIEALENEVAKDLAAQIRPRTSATAGK